MAPDDEVRGHNTGFENIYCFICGLALLAGVSFEPLWDFVERVDMYMFL
jgi:hypothetical protein